MLHHSRIYTKFARIIIVWRADIARRAASFSHGSMGLYRGRNDHVAHCVHVKRYRRIVAVAAEAVRGIRRDRGYRARILIPHSLYISLGLQQLFGANLVCYAIVCVCVGVRLGTNC